MSCSLALGSGVLSSPSGLPAGGGPAFPAVRAPLQGPCLARPLRHPGAPVNQFFKLDHKLNT